MNLRFRALGPEILDEGNFGFEEYENTMRQLELINRLTRGHQLTISALRKIVAGSELGKSGRTLRVLDVGFGYGDTLRAIARWAKKEKIDIELWGIDLSPWAKRIAEKATPADLKIRYIIGDALDPANLPGEFDVIINALFMHHLSDGEVVKMLRWMSSRARVAWFINDLHRHSLAYHFIKHVTRWFGFNPMICNDAPLSVARSFRAREWKGFLREAVIDERQVHIHWHWSFRFGLLYLPKRPRV